MEHRKATSIIIAVCNQLAYTKLAVRSILENTTVPFEFIVVDNNSRENVKEFFHALKAKADVTYVRNERNLGPIVAINQGISKSRHDYLCAIHNDVIISEHGWLDKILSVLETDPNIGIAGLAGRKEIYRNGSMNEASLKHNLQNEDLNEPMREEVSDVAVVDGMCIVFRKALLRKIKGFDEIYGYMHCYDLDISLQAIEAGFRNVVVKTEAMHIGNGGITRKTRDYKKLVKDDSGLLKKNCKIFSRKWTHLLPLNVDRRGQIP